VEIIKIQRPWGSFEQFTHNESSTVKLLYINKGGKLSLQKHARRDEFWKIISGNPTVEIGDKKFEAKIGDELTVKAQTVHRLSAPQNDVVFLEIATGDFDENDEVRLEDDYNRK
jgi:mannose-1-phosphate guanylyltransferase/mannose-1-phosphate guanylyltransferase/mannose-6-phosphate isomerase